MSKKAPMTKRDTNKPGVFGSNTGKQMGAPRMGAMQTPARLSKTRKMTGRRR